MVVLPQCQAVAGRRPHQVFAAAFEQPRVRRMCVGYAFAFTIAVATTITRFRPARLITGGLLRRFNCFGPQFFPTGFAPPLAPARRARWINRRSAARAFRP